MLKPKDIYNKARMSGYDHVGFNVQHDRPMPPKPYQGVAYGGKRSKAGMAWIGPRRATAREAAQDYCDYINGQATPALRRINKSSGHPTLPRKADVDPKIAEARALLREASKAGGPAGYIYCVREPGCRKMSKLGKSKDPPKFRLGGLQTGNWRSPMEVVHFKKVADRHRAEDELHSKFADRHKSGEWFEVDPLGDEIQEAFA